jgi:hypothetical protein
VNCVDIVERLQAEYDINLVFVSTCDPDHEVSKRGLIAKNFKDYGFISTHDKGFVAYDILVDDNIDVLRKAHAVRPQAAYVAHRQINKFGGAVPEFAWVSHAWDNNMYQLLKTLIEKRLARLEVDLV